MSIAAPPHTDNIPKGIGLAGLGGLLYSLDIPLLRLSGAEQWTLIFARGVLMFAAISIFWFLRNLRSGSRSPYIAGSAGLLVCFTSAIANITFIGSIHLAPSANIVIIVALVPLLTALTSWIGTGEKIAGWTWAAIAAAFLGIGLIVSESIEAGHFLGNALAFVAALCTAMAFTVSRASGKNVATSLAIGSALSASIALVFFGASPAAFSHMGLFWIALNGLIIVPLATSLMASGPRFMPSADVSMFFLLETVLAPVWIWFLFGESPSRTVLIGGAIVVVALLAHSAWRLLTSLGKGLTRA
jgi:drug/metabolite transporter (DMT)-like permease